MNALYLLISALAGQHFLKTCEFAKYLIQMIRLDLREKYFFQQIISSYRRMDG
jgi:hypothetical protein